MRLSSILVNGEPRLAGRTSKDSPLFNLTAIDSTLGHNLDHIFQLSDWSARINETLKKANTEHIINPKDITYAPLLTKYEKFLCLGLNYVDHATEFKCEAPTFPIVFSRFPSGIVAHNQSLVVPKASSQLDFEGELALIFGSKASRVSEEDALQHVAGYSLFNDGSIRDYQMKTHQWTIGKNVDQTGAFGPEFVSSDELPPGAKELKLETRLNRQIVQSANTGQMIFNVAKTISLLSQVITFKPGDVIAMGTPKGVGYARTPQLFMKPGDIIEVEIENIGLLKNSVVAEK